MGTTPKGARPEPIDVGAVTLRAERTRWREISRFSALIRPPPNAPITPFDTAQTGITASMLTAAPPSGQSLARLDAHLPKRPLLVVAHHAHTEAGILHDHRARCPTLAGTDLLDTLRLARTLLPALPSHSLDVLIAHLRLSAPSRRHRALPGAEATAALLMRLVADGAATGRCRTLHDLRSIGLVRAKTNDLQDPLF